MQWLHALADWVVHWAHTPYGGIALFMLAFCESSFFPIPPDLLLIALCAVDSQQSFWYASLCTAGSVLGGIFGYGLGRFGGRPLLERWVRPEKVRLVERYYRRSGAFLLQFGRFVIASTGSRGARFFLVAALFYFFGPAVNSFISKYFNVLSVLFVVLLILGFWILRTVSRGAAQDS